LTRRPATRASCSEISIRTVADTRFNYERLTRELTRVLPEGVWVGHLEVAPAAPEEAVVQAGADSATGATEPPPAMTVSGCAPSQDVVADTLDRLRALTSATDVELGSSSHESAAVGASSNKPYVVSGGAGASSEHCTGSTVAFDATVTLTAPAATAVTTPPSTTPTAATTTTGAGS